MFLAVLELIVYRLHAASLVVHVIDIYTVSLRTKYHIINVIRV